MGPGGAAHHQLGPVPGDVGGQHPRRDEFLDVPAQPHRGGRLPGPAEPLGQGSLLVRPGPREGLWVGVEGEPAGHDLDPLVQVG